MASVCSSVHAMVEGCLCSDGRAAPSSWLPNMLWMRLGSLFRRELTPHSPPYLFESNPSAPLTLRTWRGFPDVDIWLMPLPMQGDRGVHQHRCAVWPAFPGPDPVKLTRGDFELVSPSPRVHISCTTSFEELAAMAKAKQIIKEATGGATDTADSNSVLIRQVLRSTYLGTGFVSWICFF